MHFYLERAITSYAYDAMDTHIKVLPKASHCEVWRHQRLREDPKSFQRQNSHPTESKEQQNGIKVFCKAECWNTMVKNLQNLKEKKTFRILRDR